jgi:hypothetical protein
MTQTIKIRGFDGGEAERYFHEGKIKENLAATPDRCCGARPAFPAKVDELLRGEPEIGVGSVKAPAAVPGID